MYMGGYTCIMFPGMDRCETPDVQAGKWTCVLRELLRSTCLCPPGLELQTCVSTLGFYVNAGNSYAGPDACTYPQTPNYIIKKITKLHTHGLKEPREEHKTRCDKAFNSQEEKEATQHANEDCEHQSQNWIKAPGSHLIMAELKTQRSSVLFSSLHWMG